MRPQVAAFEQRMDPAAFVGPVAAYPLWESPAHGPERVTGGATGRRAASTMRSTAPGRMPAGAALPAGSSIAALAPRTGMLARHGRIESSTRATRPSLSMNTTSSANRMKNMWIELQGRISSPCPGRARAGTSIP